MGGGGLEIIEKAFWFVSNGMPVVEVLNWMASGTNSTICL